MCLNSPISVLVVVFFCDFRYLHDGLHYLLHYLDAHKLVRAVEVDTAGEDVRTRQTLEAQLGSVDTAADRFYAGWNAALLHRSEHDVDDVHVRINLLLHVIVLVVDNRLYGPSPYFSFILFTQSSMKSLRLSNLLRS